MATKKRTIKSADAVVLDVLGYEFAFDDRIEAERKIRRRLRYHDLGPYSQDRVDLLRRLKDDIQSEIHRARGSRYFVGNHGKYAAPEDFDAERMIQDLAESHPDVPREEIETFVPFAVYLYYLLLALRPNPCGTRMALGRAVLDRFAFGVQWMGRLSFDPHRYRSASIGE